MSDLIFTHPKVVAYSSSKAYYSLGASAPRSKLRSTYRKQRRRFVTVTNAGNTQNGVASLTCVSTSTLTAIVTHNAIASLTCTATVTPTARATWGGVASVTCVATITPVAKATHNAIASLANVATLSAVAKATHNAVASLANVATVTPTASVAHRAIASLTCVATVTPTSIDTHNAIANLACVSTLSSTGRIARNAIASLACVTTMTPTARATWRALASPSAVTSLTADAEVFEIVEYHSVFGHNYYPYRKLLTIPAGTAETAEVNFTYPIVLTLDPTHVENSYGIIFEDTSGTQLNHEIESYDAGTGQLVAWVEIPSIESTGTSFYIYYGKDEASPTEVSPWDSFESVYHLNNYEDSAGSLDAIVGRAPSVTSGRFGQCLDFSGIDWLTTDPDSLNTFSTISVSAWVNLSGPAQQCFYSRGSDTTGGYSFSFGCAASGKLSVSVQTTDGVNWFYRYLEGDTVLDDLTWYHVAAVWESGDGLTLYVNGVPDGNLFISEYELASAPAINQIGRLNGTNNAYAKIDELRITGALRLQNWFRTEYNSYGALTIGPEQMSLSLDGDTLYTANYIIDSSGTFTFSGAIVPWVSYRYSSTSEGGFTSGFTLGFVVGSSVASFTFSGAANYQAKYKVRGRGEFVLTAHTGSYGGAWGGAYAHNTNYTPIQANYFPRSTGTLALSGSASRSITYTPSASGGITFFGLGDFGYTYPVGLYSIFFSGTAPATLILSTTGSGSIAFSGTAEATVSFTPVGSGLIALSGASPYSVAYTPTAAGEVVLSGTASRAAHFNASSGGQITFNGSSPSYQTSHFAYVGSGAVSFEGETASGSFTLGFTDGFITGSGVSANYKANYFPLTTGEIEFSGSALVSSFFGSGEIVFSGSADTQANYQYISSGSIYLHSPPIPRMVGSIEAIPLLSGSITSDVTVLGTVEARALLLGRIDNYAYLIGEVTVTPVLEGALA